MKEMTIVGTVLKALTGFDGSKVKKKNLERG